MPELRPTRKSRRNPILRRLELAAPALMETYGIRRIGIFGSFARGDQTKKSDVDVLVEFADGHASLHNLVYLADELEVLFKRKVDLLTIGGIDKYIRPGIEKEVIWIEE